MANEFKVKNGLKFPDNTVQTTSGVTLTGDQSISGAKTIAAATDYGVNKLRNVKLMTTVPIAGDFNGNGDLIFVYVP